MKILILFFIVLGSVCNAELRTWTSIVGTKVEAELVSLTGNQVTLKTKDGKTLKLPLNKLSKADQEFLTAKASPKEPTKEETPVNPNLMYEVKDSAVAITGCDKQASGTLTISAVIEGKPVTSIGKSAFYNCRSLTSITIPDNVTSIERYAFGFCSRLTSITIPDSVTSIGKQAFDGCKNLTSITVPDSVTSIGGSAFYACSSLTNVTIPEGVTSIGSSAFGKCTSLTSVTIGDSVTSIGGYAFYACSSLTSITIPDSVTSIGVDAFRDCRSLTSITIPASVTSIGDMAFTHCTSLKSVTFLGDAPKWSAGVFYKATPTIYRKPEAKGWGDTFAGRPVKLISEKP